MLVHWIDGHNITGKLASRQRSVNAYPKLQIQEPTMRPSGREPDQLRSIVIKRNYTRHAEGSVLICCGDTHVLCTASVEERVPPFLRGKGLGWVTAEYGMLPRSTGSRMARESSRGKQSGRTLEIQRLIGRSLRAVVDRAALGERTITLDCDVLQADGGTRTASITGAYVALMDACNHLLRKGTIKKIPIYGQVAAVSVGIFGPVCGYQEGTPLASCAPRDPCRTSLRCQGSS